MESNKSFYTTPTLQRLSVSAECGFALSQHNPSQWEDWD